MAFGVQTIEQFLQQKLFNLRTRLWEEHGASAAKLDMVGEYLTTDPAKGLTAYAHQLHREWAQLPARATQLVEFVEVPEDKKERAVACVKEYFTAFVSVVQPGD